MGLSIIIPTHNRKKNLLTLIAQLSHVTADISAEIIVVNDVSSDNLHEFIPAHVIYIVNQKGGVAASRNIGAQAASHENLLFIDDDMLISEEAVKFVNSFLNETDHSIINVNWVYPDELLDECQKTKFGRYLIKSGHTTLKGWMNNTNWHAGKIYEVNGLGSAFMGIKAQDFKNIGGYNEQIPFAGFEDHEFASRVEKSGIKIVLNTSITIHHNEAENIYQENWLKRKYRNSYTRGVGVAALNFSDMKLEYSGIKRTLFKMIYGSRPFFRFMLFLVPNSRLTDKLYYSGFEKLYGSYLHAGYAAGLNSINKSLSQK